MLETVYEKDIDFLLVEELYVSPYFQDWLVTQLSSSLRKFHGGWRSVTRFNGESDIEFTYEDTSGAEVRALVENKIKADEQPRQAARYSERAAKYVQLGEADQAYTCIVAPEHYLDQEIVAKYDKHVTYEAIRDWFDEQEGVRAQFKVSVLEAAITVGEQRYIKSTDEETQEFWRHYERLAQEYPELEFTVAHTPASGTTWFRFNPSGLDDDAAITHKADRGVVHLSLAGRGGHLAAVRDAVSDVLDKDMRCERTSQSASIAIDVPAFSDLSDPSSKSGTIQDALKAASRLLTWEQRHRDQWQATPSSK
ncbi:hypothetical protein [Halorarius halobius]|uniref:hypothetical protein n=1 Tax=Halorarius halobius TaxID=2962671 RepID=UPI0020CF4581|nr:hypothetical protein [Halorarius halobius]